VLGPAGTFGVVECVERCSDVESLWGRGIKRKKRHEDMIGARGESRQRTKGGKRGLWTGGQVILLVVSAEADHKGREQYKRAEGPKRERRVEGEEERARFGRFLIARGLETTVALAGLDLSAVPGLGEIADGQNEICNETRRQ
jgi:hypothetical protein